LDIYHNSTETSPNNVRTSTTGDQIRDKYVFYRLKSLFGLCVLLFIKESIVPRIKDVYTGKICTGKGIGYTKNKGCSALRLSIDKTSFMFLNCHLQSGAENKETRVKNMNNIFEKVFQKHETKGVANVMDSDFVFVFGDLNFRVDLDDTMIRKAIKHE